MAVHLVDTAPVDAPSQTAGVGWVDPPALRVDVDAEATGAWAVDLGATGGRPVVTVARDSTEVPDVSLEVARASVDLLSRSVSEAGESQTDPQSVLTRIVTALEPYAVKRLPEERPQQTRARLLLA